ncbi:mechanosensitive ion channel domain-containing protein [Shewanella ulleungensis]|uniref:Mechanosensitive ion channel protein MscS n=1 Tax=Shewanella ulleungensis TaxID=2282699 RepID=A0ABQ2QEA8_9GAMM|nr:mechanosensitive ion channel domain-containing protein [Shewanella ulleungensis]MCL1149303.1 mechanosensitive ion channel [Shewanella ulleungensis]GGP78235.1 mechanosensitive ion channel protein MscS [Shewanella ulleungensis]
MLRLASSLLCFIIINIVSASTYANTPITLDKRLGLNTQADNQPLDIQTQIAELESSINELQIEQQTYNNVERSNTETKLSLNQQLRDAQTTLKLDADIDLNQQASMAYFHLSELKETESYLNQQLRLITQRQIQLPDLIVQAENALSQHNKTQQAPADTPLGKRNKLQAELLTQHIATLQAERLANPKQLEIAQLQQQVNRLSLSQQESFIELINKHNIEHRQQQTADTIANNLIDEQELADPLSQELSQTNQQYAQQLQSLTSNHNLVIERQQRIEKRYQSQNAQLSNVLEQITWVKTNSAFGDRFLQMLQSLPKPPSLDKLQTELADARLKRYQLEQQQALNTQQLDNSTLFNETQVKLLQSQQILIEQLLQGYDQYLAEFAKLRIGYEQLNQLHNTLKNTLNEHLFWVPNAPSIGGLWLIDLSQSSVWLVQPSQYEAIQQAWSSQSHLWAWWGILLLCCLMAQDMLTPKFNQAIGRYSVFVGNVTQDKFKYTIKTLIISLVYALIKPLPVIIAGVIFMHSEQNVVYAVGSGVTAIGISYLIYRFFYLLTVDKGILISHFRRPKKIVQQAQKTMASFVMISAPLIGLMGFTEALDTSLVRNSLGRGAFIIFCVVLFVLYKDMMLLIGQYRKNKPNANNLEIVQKAVWAILIVTPLFSAILACIGYYFTAFQLLLQLQISVLLGLGFLLTYQLIKRWMLIERRLIAFDRAKAKRAERLAQRERGELNNEPIETYEEPIVDLETISSQSLGLVRSILILAFFASLLGILAQTHTAVFSFLDGITLWTTTSTLNGIEQQVPITLKSILFGIVLVGFSAVIAKNLPGLLELMLLQRLDLSPGTGFAITTISSYLVVFFGMLFGFSTLGMEWSKLQWLVAALSVGLGFGLQEIFANFISGLIILFEKPIRIGDTVTIRDLTGTVSKIQIRATTIVDWDRKEIIVPNKAFITEQLVNWSLSDPITRVIVTVSVSRDADPAKVETLLHQAVRECELSLSTPEPEVWFAGFGQHTQDYEVRSYAKDMSVRWPLRHSLHKQISQKLKENHIELAYPQMEVHIKHDSRDSSELVKS